MTEQQIEKTEVEPKFLLEVDQSTMALVLARNPDEMRKAQDVLVDWATKRVAKAEADVAEADANVQLSKDMKHNMAGPKRAASLARGTVTYYRKIKEALESGYCIVPDFPIDVIAVRTDKEAPSDSEKKHRFNVSDVHHAQLPSGEGTYVGPEPQVAHRTITVQEGDKTKTEDRFWATGFRDVAFPVKLARMQVLEGLKRAQALKIFDEIGILPAENRRSKDPMIIGRVQQRLGPYRTRSMSFLVAWWIDLETL